MPITDLLEENARKFGSDVALVEVNPQVQETRRVLWKDYDLIQPTSSFWYRREITWHVFDEKANRFAQLLMSRGVKKGDKVAILLMNCLEWLPIYFGVLKTGALAVPMNFRYSAEEIEYCLDYETGTPLKAPRMMPNFRELKHALKMPQFDLKTIYGTDVNLSDYKGKVIVLNVWATWCRPCVAEIPELITAQKALKNSDVRVIGVAVDGENVDLKKFLDKIRASGFETFIDGNQAIPGKMGVSVVPTNFIIDGNGNLVAYAEGYLPWENPQIISFLKEIGKKYASGPSAAKKPASAPVGSVGSVFKISQF